MRNDSFDEHQKDLRESVLNALTNSSEKSLSAQEIARVVVSDQSWPDLLAPIRRVCCGF